jgi:pimeloyl-ACP methyl ester carboxylesterase
MSDASRAVWHGRDMARLHHERIAHSAGTPDRWLVFTHGIYGAGSNWRGIARKIVDKRRDWGIVLVDLRAHGKSETGEPPHTLDACADDVRALVESLGSDVRALAGHSFGGKVMLAARERMRVEQTWMLDSNPSPRPGALEDESDSVVRVLRMLERMPRTWASRDAFVSAVMADGFDDGLAQWLAMSVVPDGDQFINRLDPAVLRELLASYFASDLWGTAEDASRGRLDMVVATKSSVWSAQERERLGGLGTHVNAHEVDAGHWLHIDAPGPVVDLFVTELPTWRH